MWARMISLFLLLVYTGRCIAATYGSCSRSCLSPSTNDSKKSQCSCSPSCLLYHDCCYDSPHKIIGYMNPEVSTVCLPLEDVGDFLAVSRCPRFWNDTVEPCRGNLGLLPPVTSRKTGVTYTNVNCAKCNDDCQDIVTWNTTTKCSSTVTAGAKPQFVAKHNKLWMVHFDKAQQRGRFSQCTYHLQGSKEGLLSVVEIRSCEKDEISSCSMTWKSFDVYKSCKSYLDPVYVRDKIYRNRHCAACNYETISEATCMPSVVIQMNEMNLTREQMREYCKKNNLKLCLHNLSSSSGALRPFWNLLVIESMECLPPPGKRCCTHEVYDYKYKRCRKVVPKDGSRFRLYTRTG